MKQCTRQQRGLPAEALAKAGFTLVELLMVIGIIGVLAAIVVVAINPTKQLGSARDTKRRSEVNSILNAVSQYAIDHGGRLPCDPSGSPCVDGTWRMLGNQGWGCDETPTCNETGIASACLFLRSLSGTYITTIPADPRFGSGNGLDAGSKSFYIVRTVEQRINVKACQAEAGEVSTISR